MTATLKIGKMVVEIEGNQVKTSHPTDEMKNNRSTFEIKDSLRGGQVVVFADRHINRNQSSAALNKIKEAILKGSK